MRNFFGFSAEIRENPSKSENRILKDLDESRKNKNFLANFFEILEKIFEKWLAELNPAKSGNFQKN